MGVLRCNLENGNNDYSATFLSHRLKWHPNAYAKVTSYYQGSSQLKRQSDSSADSKLIFMLKCRKTKLADEDYILPIFFDQPTDSTYIMESLAHGQQNHTEVTSLQKRLSRQNYDHSILSGAYLHSYYSHQNSTCWLNLGQTTTAL